MLAQIVNSICIEDDHFVFANTSDEVGEEFLHITVTAKSWTNYPWVDCLLPGADLVYPFLVGLRDFLWTHLSLLFGYEDGVDYDFWGIGFDGNRGRLGTKNMGEVPACLKSWNCCVVRCPCELIAAPDDSTSPVVAFLHFALEAGQYAVKLLD